MLEKGSGVDCNFDVNNKGGAFRNSIFHYSSLYAIYRASHVLERIKAATSLPYTVIQERFWKYGPMEDRRQV